MHTFNKVLSDEKWNGIIVCNGIFVCTVPFREGKGGRRGTSIIAQVLPNKKAQNKCDGGRAQGGKYVKW
jgi:hypothetical protein